MKTFTMTYDRHKGMYGYKTSNFASEIDRHTPVLDYARDPDWTAKV